MNLTVVGDVLWLVAYIFIIRASFRDRTYGVPMLAICLNFAWEFIFTFVYMPREGDGSLNVVKFCMFLGWLVLDAVILWQLLKYGRKEQSTRQLEDMFIWVVLLCLGGAFAWHLTFTRAFDDPHGYLSAFIINLLMSILFVRFAFDRPDQRGLSYGGAWFKLLGTGIISFANVFMLLPTPGYHGFWFFLFAGIFTFDLLYLVILHQGRKARTAAAAT
ncbi:MAG: hypothetical protein PVF05_10280 [Gemmatimonadales bacterium]|jgi:hypothetical protein